MPEDRDHWAYVCDECRRPATTVYTSLRTRRAHPGGVACFVEELQALADHAHRVALALGKEHYADSSVLLLVVGVVGEMARKQGFNAEHVRHARAADADVDAAFDRWYRENVCDGTGSTEGGPAPSHQSAAAQAVPVTISDELQALADHAHRVALALGKEHYADSSVLLLVVGVVGEMARKYGGRSRG